jgi:hypothetical protein
MNSTVFVTNKNQLESTLTNKELYDRIEKLEGLVNKLEENINNFQKIKQTNSNLEIRNRKKDYKTPIKEILSATSLQFLLSPIRSKRILIKMINSCFLIISLCFSVTLVVSNINGFLMYETTTSITTVNDNKPDFPVVSFCSIGKSSYGNISVFWFNDELLTSDWQNYFEAFQDSTYSDKCYRFNSGLNMTNHSVLIQKSKRSGYNDGFYIEFDSDVKLLLVSIYNQTEKPSTIYNKGYYFSNGSEYDIKIKRTYDKKLEYPYNDCLNDLSKFTKNKTIINYMQKKNSLYTEKECIRLCGNLKYIEESYCNCSFKNLDDYPYKKCRYNSELKDCYKKFMNILNNQDKDQICSEYCPLECDSFSYDISINSQSYVAGDLFVFSIFYEDLKYTLISQQPKMQFIDLISNIGGSLGLFVGISFISFLELFEILIEIIFIHFEK